MQGRPQDGHPPLLLFIFISYHSQPGRLFTVLLLVTKQAEKTWLHVVFVLAYILKTCTFLISLSSGHMFEDILTKISAIFL